MASFCSLRAPSSPWKPPPATTSRHKHTSMVPFSHDMYRNSAEAEEQAALQDVPSNAQCSGLTPYLGGQILWRDCFAGNAFSFTQLCAIKKKFPTKSKENTPKIKTSTKTDASVPSSSSFYPRDYPFSFSALYLSFFSNSCCVQKHRQSQGSGKGIPKIKQRGMHWGKKSNEEKPCAKSSHHERLCSTGAT